MYQLKKGQEAFTVVEGQFAGRNFKPGERYKDIPPGMSKRFSEIDAATAPQEPATEAVKPKTEKKSA